MDRLVIAKAVCCFIVLLLNSISAFSIFFVIQTKCLHRRKQSLVWQRGLSMANCFCIGLFLSVCFLGLYNSAAAKMHAIQATVHDVNLLKTYPISEFILCMGLLILWVIEWTLRSWIVSLTTVVRPVYEFIETEPDEAFEYPDENENDSLSPLCHSSSSVTPTYRRSMKKSSVNTLVDGPSFLKVGFLMGAMSIHTFLESLGFGMLDSHSQVVTMALAMAIHNILCSGTLGFRMSSACGTPRSRCLAVGLLIGYLCLLPLGTLTGSLIHGDRFITSINPNLPSNASIVDPNDAYFNCTTHYSRCIFMAILQLFAASAFLYVLFVEILPNEIAASMPTGHGPSTDHSISIKRGICCCLSAFFGFLLIAGVRLIHHH